MATQVLRGVVRGGLVVLGENGAPLPDGTEVLVTPVAGGFGSADALIAAVNTAPRVPAEWVDELEELIAQGRRPPARPNPFSDEGVGPEQP